VGLSWWESIKQTLSHGQANTTWVQRRLAEWWRWIEFAPPDPTDQHTLLYSNSGENTLQNRYDCGRTGDQREGQNDENNDPLHGRL
jgi:hypothetical protein